MLDVDQPEPNRCILTGDILIKEIDSKAHVIPSALGGRLKPTGILSQKANTQLGDSIDLLLIEALSPIMSQLDGSRDRGSNRTVTMEDQGGEKYVVAFNQPISMERPKYTETETEDTTVFKIQARNLREARTLMGRIKKKHPSFDIDEAMKHAVVAQTWPEGGTLKLELEVGPRRTFPGAFVAASVFSAFHGLAPHPSFKSFVNSFSLENPAIPPDTFYFYLDEEWVSVPPTVCHTVVLIADPARKQSLVFIDLFNILSIAVVLPYTGISNRCESYAVDVLTGSTVLASVDLDKVLSAPWSATHDNNSTFWSILRPRIERVGKIAQQRAEKAWLESAVARASAKITFPLTSETLLDAIREVAATTHLELRRPNLPLGRQALYVEQLTKMVQEFGHMLPLSEQAHFRAYADVIIEGLQRVANV